MNYNTLIKETISKYLLEETTKMVFLGYHSSRNNMKSAKYKGSLLDANSYEDAIRNLYSEIITDYDENLENNDIYAMNKVFNKLGYGFTFVSKTPITASSFQNTKFKYGDYLYKVYGNGTELLVDDPNEINATIVVSKKPLYFENITDSDELNESANENAINTNDLPTYLYHVTTNYNDVVNSGVLLSKSGLNSGGLGGTDTVGVSFVSDINVAKNIYNELKLINDVNSARTDEEVITVINNVDDDERKAALIENIEYTIDVYNSYRIAALMALRNTRNSYKFRNKPFHGIIIFHEENIKNKDIGIIKINKNQIPIETEVILGADNDFGEIRVIGDVPLK